jgi:hypothetical protein
MASNPVTVAALNLSPEAIRIIFEKTTTYNYNPIQEVAADQIAMQSTSLTLLSLETVIDNNVAWSYFNSSPYYEQYVVNVLCTLL